MSLKATFLNLKMYCLKAVNVLFCAPFFHSKFWQNHWRAQCIESSFQMNKKQFKKPIILKSD